LKCKSAFRLFFNFQLKLLRQMIRSRDGEEADGAQLCILGNMGAVALENKHLEPFRGKVVISASQEEALGIIEARKPLGLFLCLEGNGGCTGIDNSSGHAWTETFTSLSECMEWLSNACLEKGVRLHTQNSG
jgi:hypothetical protein